MSKYEQTLSELEEFLDNCKRQKLSNTNIVVNKEQIDEYISELKLKTPEEIRKYQRIINNRDAILNSAQENANQIIEQARMETSELISEHEIMQQAFQQANELVDDATAQAQQILDNAVSDADAIRNGAMEYTDQILANVQNIIAHTMESITIKYDNLMKQLNTSLEVVIANRQELNPPAEQNAQVAEEKKENVEKKEEKTIESVTNQIEDFTVDLT